MDRATLSRLDALFRDARDGVCVADPRGKVIYTNPAARRLMGAACAGAPRVVCALLCDAVAGDAPPPSRCCPLLDPRGAPAETVKIGRSLRVACTRLGIYGTQWDRLHIVRVERVGAAELAAA